MKALRNAFAILCCLSGMCFAGYLIVAILTGGWVHDRTLFYYRYTLGEHWPGILSGLLLLACGVLLWSGKKYGWAFLVAAVAAFVFWLNN